MEAGAEVLWPEQESLYSLMCLRATIGPAAFASEKQGDPVNPEQCEWDASYFDYPGFWFDTWPSGIVLRTLGLDPSKGKDAQHGDYSAFVKLGMDKDLVLYVEADLQRRPTPQIVADGVELVLEPDEHPAAKPFKSALVADAQLWLESALYDGKLRLIGAPMGQSAEKEKAVSPVTYVSKDAAPMLIIHGTADTHYGGLVRIVGDKPWQGTEKDDTFRGGCVTNIQAFIDSVRNAKPINNAPTAAESNLTAILGRTAAYEQRLVTWDQMMASTERWQVSLPLRW
jgi:hypothetical protein